MNLKPIKAEHVKDVLTEKLNLDTRVTTLGHTQRGGKPCAVDRIFVSPSDTGCDLPSHILQPTLQAIEAIDVLLEATPTTPSYMIGMQENKVKRVPLKEAVELVRPFMLFIRLLTTHADATSRHSHQGERV